MKGIGFLLVLFNLVCLSPERVAARGAMEDLREHLYDIMKCEEKTRYYISQLDVGCDPVSRAYFGALNACMASHVFFPMKKWNYFVTGREQLELAVSESPGSIEIRFLRLLIQSTAPSWLGYSSNVRSDLNFIIDQLEMNLCEEKDRRSTITKNLVELGSLDAEDHAELKLLLSKNSIQ